MKIAITFGTTAALYVTMDAGDGDDYIRNYQGDKVLIAGGNGNDSISNSGSNVTMDAGAGDDSISNGGSNVSINAGAGNDTIWNYVGGDTVTINGGAGDDSISLNHDSKYNVILYNEGDGNDTIYGFNESDTLKISGGSYSTIKSGDDLIVTVGTSSIILKGAASLSAVNIDGEEVVNTFLTTLTEGDDEYSNKLDGAIILALGGKDSINSRGRNVLINGGAGKDIIYNYGGEWVTIVGESGNDRIYNGYYSNAGNYVSISAGAGNDTIRSWGKKVTIEAGAGNDSVNSYGDKVSIDAGSGDDYIVLTSRSEHNVIVYNAGDGFDTISRFNEDDTLKILGGSYSTTKSGDDLIVTVGEGKITLVGAASLETVKILGKEEAVNPLFITLTEGDDTCFNTLDGALIQALGGNDSIHNDHGSRVTIHAGAGNDYIDSSGDSSTIDAGTGSDSIENDGRQVSIAAGDGNDYIFNIGGSQVSISAGAGDDSISLYSGIKFYNVIIYNKGDGNDTLTGFNEDDTLKISGGSYSSQISGSDIILTVGEGNITLQGAASLSAVNIDGEEIQSTWKLNGTTATCGSLVITGVISLDGIKLDGTTVTVTKSSLGTNDVTISDGYTLALGSTVPAPTTSAATYSDGVYKTAGVSKAGYSLDGNTIRYVAKDIKTIKFSGADDDATVKNFYLSGNVMTIGKAAVKTDGTAFKLLTDGYSLKLGKGMTASATDDAWTLSGTTAKLKRTTTASYSLDGNSIIYSKKSSKTLATVTGVNDKSGLKVSGSTIKLSGDALSKKVTVSGDYTFDFDYSNATISGSSSDDTIIARGKNIFVTGGDGSDVFALKSTGKIGDYDSEDKISLTGAADISTDGNDLIFNKKITVAGAADKVVTYIEGGVEKIFEPEENDAVQYNAAGTAVTLTANYSEDFSVANDTLVTIDASAVNQEINIVANKKANSIVGSEEDDTIDGGAAKDTIRSGDGNDQIFGGKGNDKIYGGAGSDSLWGGLGEDTLTGGKGYDAFIYSDGDGRDLITDYEPDVDRIMILSGKVENPTTDTDGNVTFRVGDGQIVIADGASKYIELYDGSGNNLTQKYIPR